MRRICCAILICISMQASGQSGLPLDEQSEEIAKLESGVICAQDEVGEAPAPDTVAGTTHLIDFEPEFVSTTNIVPAVLGIGFGVKATAVDPIGLSNVTITITHPPMGNDARRSQSFVTSISGADRSLTFYQFDYVYELLPGTWQMQATQDARLLYRTEFQVVRPDLVPELAARCGFEDLLS